MLLPGLEISLCVEATGVTNTWCFAAGMQQYLAEQLDGELAAPMFTAEKYAQSGDENFPVGSGAAWALCWSAEGNLARESYVNLIPTPAGGTHETGLRQAAFEAVKGFAEHRALLPKGVKLAAEDVFSRASYVLAARVLDPSFQARPRIASTRATPSRSSREWVRDPPGTVAQRTPRRRQEDH